MNRPPLKTYSHLAVPRDGSQDGAPDGRPAARLRLPSEYEIVTTDLLYYPGHGGFEVETPIAAWYRAHQTDSPLRCARWERFADPRQTTYAKYTTLAKQKEEFVGRLLAGAEEEEDRALADAWLALLGRALAPQRFVFHGLQMVAAYVGQMAPAGRIAVAAAFQAADELRRVQRVAFRIAQLRRRRAALAEVDAESRRAWQGDPRWQPLRRSVERLLVTYDWGEALVALNVCARPAFDHLLLVELGRLAPHHGDFALSQTLASFAEDGAWHGQWTRALLAVAIADEPRNAATIARWVDAWRPLVDEAVEGAAALLAVDDPAIGPAAAARASEAARAYAQAVLEGAP